MELVLFLVLAGVLSLTEGQICNLNPIPFDCQEAYVLGCRRSGVYTIDPGCGTPFSVWCDMNNGGGWTVFQRRRDGLVEFYRGWAEYEDGFGNVKGEHWLGLKKISCLTGAKPVAQLRVDLADFEGNHKYAHYRYFSVDSASANYTLSVGGYSGTAGDSMTSEHNHNHNGMQFTTYDRDNDRWGGNCAVTYQGAWWYIYCHSSNLNGKYQRGASDCDGVRWQTFNTVSCYSLKWSEMKLR